MPKDVSNNDGRVVLEASDLGRLLEALQEDGYRVVGPTRSDGAIIYAELSSAEDLPRGWRDRQSPGAYRLERRTDESWFGYVVGPHSWKQFFNPPESRLWSIQQGQNHPEFQARDDDVPKLALLGVRPCELSAIQVQDQVLLEGPYVDPAYKARRDGTFLAVVNCTEPGGTCFCASMNTGPGATTGYDLGMTEMLDAKRHYFVVHPCSKEGLRILAKVRTEPAGREEVQAAEAAVSDAVAKMGRVLETSGLKEVLYRSYDHPRWDDVGKRCLTCANCTMACPTCFCFTVEDVTDLTGSHAERRRKWDSCFSLDFSYIHGGHVRVSSRARYRQWMIHKLATWLDQFGSFGCVGCGRCITWCPVGIDITEEARAIRASDL